MRKRVIASANLPADIKIYPYLVAWLTLDRLNAPGWVWGAVGVVYALMLIGSIAQYVTQTEVDVLKKEQTQ